MENFDVKDLANNKVEEIALDSDVFGIDPNYYSISDLVRWQLAKRRNAIQCVKGRSDVSGTTRKNYKQKGTGGARRGSLRAAQFRGGGVIFAPKPRDYEFKLNKKVKRLALRSLLSLKIKENKFVIVNDINIDEPKTKIVVNSLNRLKLDDALVFDVDAFSNFAIASKNLNNVKVLSVAGLNGYDILNYSNLVVTKSAVKMIEERLKD